MNAQTANAEIGRVHAFILLLAIAVGCNRHGPTEPAVPTHWSVVLRVPGSIYAMTSAPDGAMFVSMFDGSVYRTVDSAVTWERIVEPDTSQGRNMYLYAPSGRTFFAVSGDAVLRWDESRGIRAEPTPISHSVRMCEGGGLIAGERLNAIWGRGENDVFAVGDQAIILHFDGARWALEPNPLSGPAPGPCWWYPEGFLHAVGGDLRHVYAAGTQTLRRTDNGTWEVLPAPAPPGERAGTFGIVSQDGAPIFGGQFNHADGGSVTNPIRFFRPSTTGGTDTWEILWKGRHRDLMNAGTSSSSGRSVFWSYGRDVLIVEGRAVAAYRMSMLTHQVRGVALVGSETYVSGISGDSSFVLRVPKQ